jgi:hypothetical protein
VLLGVAAVGVERAELQIGFEEVPIEQLIDGRAGARLSTLINLVLQPSDGLSASRSAFGVSAGMVSRR